MRSLLASIIALASSFAIVTAGAQAPRDEGSAFVLSIDRQGTLFVTADGTARSVSESAVVEQAAAALRRDAGTALIVEADEATPYDSVTRAARLLQEAGATRISFRTRAPAPR